MFIKLKSRLRDLLPKRFQVPIKYFVDYLRGNLESELGILNFFIKPTDRVIDVGGNRGLYAYKFSRLGAEVKVFEPNPNCLMVLNKWAANKPEINIYSVALSNYSGTATLHVPIDISGFEHDASASLEENKFNDSRDKSIVVKTLDEFKFLNIKLIKIDVEGHESKVIEGAVLTLASSRPVLIVEIEQRHIKFSIKDVFHKIKSLGYRGFFILQGDLLSIDKFQLDKHQRYEAWRWGDVHYVNNFIFLHESKIAEGFYSDFLKLVKS